MKAKLPFNSKLVFPMFSVLGTPLKTYTLPHNQVANGIIDAFIHIVEQYLTTPAYAKSSGPLRRRPAADADRRSPLALKDPENYDVRANVMGRNHGP